MNGLWDGTGGYGKGSLSRGGPFFALADTAVAAAAVGTKGRALRNLSFLEAAAAPAGGAAVVQRAAQRRAVEHLALALPEAYHAAFEADPPRLRIHPLERTGGGGTGGLVPAAAALDAATAWAIFCSRSADGAAFAAAYAAYRFYRAAGWAPRSGAKYGVDWVLYKVGAARHAHASFCVVLSARGLPAGTPSDGHTPTSTAVRKGGGCAPLDATWVAVQNRLRLVKNVAKTLLYTEVADPAAPGGRVVAAAVADRDAWLDRAAVVELRIDRWTAS
ncbi:hypothetical protein MMPV_001131 [Pyropia vietnamensis]